MLLLLLNIYLLLFCIYIYIYINIPAEFSPSAYLLLNDRFAIAKRQFWLEKRGLRTWGFNFSIFKRPEVESRQLLDECRSGVASRMCGSCRRTCSGVASRMCGRCRRTGSGVASRMCVSAIERYCPTPPHQNLCVLLDGKKSASINTHIYIYIYILMLAA